VHLIFYPTDTPTRYSGFDLMSLQNLAQLVHSNTAPVLQLLAARLFAGIKNIYIYISIPTKSLVKDCTDYKSGTKTQDKIQQKNRNESREHHRTCLTTTPREERGEQETNEKAKK